ncbi:uncharacterized protein LOC135941948 isoform X2 [Cloeon dipterum]|uniref:uncharacterized protein LOC135941948 isoform X2 n=1 Tax=Cloeon dipterum TaxID=197152 RepID=UPI00321FEE35
MHSTGEKRKEVHAGHQPYIKGASPLQNHHFPHWTRRKSSTWSNMKTTLFVLVVISSGMVADALFLPLIYRIFGAEEVTPSPPTRYAVRQPDRPYPGQRAPPSVTHHLPQAAPMQQPVHAEFAAQIPQVSAPHQPAQFAILRTQQLVQAPWYPSTFRGYEQQGGYAQVQAQVPIHPGEVKSLDGKMENAPIIVGTGYNVHQSK